MLNTSIQNNAYDPSNNFFNHPSTCSSPLIVSQTWFDQYRELYCRGSEIYCLMRNWRSSTPVLGTRESSSSQMLNLSWSTIVSRQTTPSCRFASWGLTR